MWTAYVLGAVGVLLAVLGRGTELPRSFVAALAVGAAVAVVAPVTYVTVRHERYAAFDAVLFARAEQAAVALDGDLARAVQFGGADFGDGVRPAVVYAQCHVACGIRLPEV
jgi:hypothetical protein